MTEKQSKSAQPKKSTEHKASASYVSVSIKPLEKSRSEIIGSIAVETLEKYRKQALKDINDSISIDGFRKGMIPENILISKVGEMAILEEMSELAISQAYLDIIIDNKIDAIGKPEVHVTKLAAGNPLEFKIVTAVVPEIKLPDYQKIAKEETAKQNPDDAKVTDKDVEDAILRIRKSRVSHEGHDHEKMTPEEHEKSVMADLPELNDDFVKTLGDFTDVPDFKNKLSTMIADDKRRSEQEKTRMHIADAISEATKAELPDIMIESELRRTEDQFKADIERMGVKLEDYLKHAKKTVDEIRAEWRPHAEKKAKLQLILNAIAQKENLRPDVAEVKAEVDQIMEHYKDADRESATTYTETVLTNEKVFQFIESK